MQLAEFQWKWREVRNSSGLFLYDFCESISRIMSSHITSCSKEGDLSIDSSRKITYKIWGSCRLNTIRTGRGFQCECKRHVHSERHSVLLLIERKKSETTKISNKISNIYLYRFIPFDTLNAIWKMANNRSREQQQLLRWEISTQHGLLVLVR